MATVPTGYASNIFLTSNNYVELTGLQFQPGSNGSAYDKRSLAIELPLAQRYYEKSTPIDVSASASTGSTDGADILTMSATTMAQMLYSTEKFQQPSVDLYSPVLTNPATARYNARLTTGADICLTPTSTKKSLILAASTSNAFGKSFWTQWAADAEVAPLHPPVTRGAVEWISAMRGSIASCNAFASAVTALKDGSIVTTGYFNNPVLIAYHASDPNSNAFGTTLTNTGGNDVYICKHSASGTVQWLAALSGPSTSTDQSIGLAGTTDGHIAAVGTYTAATLTAFGADGTAAGQMTNAAGNAGTEDLFVAKYSKAGQVQWLAGITSLEADGAAGVVATRDGGIVVAGNSTMSNFLAYNADGSPFATTLTQLSASNDAFLVKYTNAGYIHWVTRIASMGQDYAQALCATADAGVALVGRYSTSLTAYNASSPNSAGFLTQLTANAGADDAFVVKYDVTGSVQWMARVASSGSDTPSSVAATLDGGVLVWGVYTSGTVTAYPAADPNGAGFGTVLTASGSGSDSFLVKFSSAGAVQWVTRVAGGTALKRVLCMTDGSLVASTSASAGAFSVYSSDAPNSNAVSLTPNGADSFILKFSADGLYEESAQITGNGTEAIAQIAATADNSILAHGHSTSYFLLPYDSSSGNNLRKPVLNTLTNSMPFLAKYSSFVTPPASQLIKNNWTSRVSGGPAGGGLSGAYTVDADVDGNIYAAGPFSSSNLTIYNAAMVAYGTSLTKSSSQEDLFVAKFSQTGSVLWVARVSAATLATYGGSLAASLDGGLVIAGMFSGAAMTIYDTTGAAATSLVNSGSSTLNTDGFICVLSSSGQLTWAGQLDCGGVVAVNGVCQAQDQARRHKDPT
ncbi:hypothetical protein HYH03_015929 [Edaphochlamys debaryana]|uniref:Uncharacterized protein n=1 Tax=Edaphochlamys debaryana TaxID=47281 RepID=A0A835XM78_9CHLO|nr:hypothetical protein HYH03_015929 [Edaphochlamys debaryana]|eukprot:KAG2485348.1 hypothetical protein HYH03_015929 [Edaphochlamys debaryana]